MMAPLGVKDPNHPQLLAHYRRLGEAAECPLSKMWLRQTIGLDKRSRRIRKRLEIMAEGRRKGVFVA